MLTTIDYYRNNDGNGNWDLETWVANPSKKNTFTKVAHMSHGYNWELRIEGEDDDDETYDPCKAQVWGRWETADSYSLEKLRSLKPSPEWEERILKQSS